MSISPFRIEFRNLYLRLCSDEKVSSCRWDAREGIQNDDKAALQEFDFMIGDYKKVSLLVISDHKILSASVVPC